ncbi:MAG TPA: YggT family protein [Chloroflexota bacterium]|nr:YggT family protein [Chloroflexota bacterium]
MQDRTEIIETTPAARVNGVPRSTTEVRTVEQGVGAVDRMETVAYDPYANKRIAAVRVIQLVYLIFGLIEGLIAIRFVLKALGANASAGFAQFIYGITTPLVAPFYGLFGNPASQGSVLEVHSIVALVVYALLAWLIVRLTWILVGESRSAVQTRSTSVDTRL